MVVKLNSVSCFQFNAMGREWHYDDALLIVQINTTYDNDNN